MSRVPADRYPLLMTQFMSAVQRLKLAAAKLSMGEKALPREYVPAAFVVEEATQALERIQWDLYDMEPPPGTSSATEQGRPPTGTLGSGRGPCPKCGGEGCAWCEPDEAGQPSGYLRAA